MPVVAALVRLFSQSVNFFFPIVEPLGLDTILARAQGPSHEKEEDEDAFLDIILAIAMLVGKRNNPQLASRSREFFAKAMAGFTLSCNHSCRRTNMRLLQRVLLISVYLLLSPESGDVWRYMGFAIRLFLDLEHRPSMDKDKDDQLFDTLTRTLYCLEWYV